jgi:alkylhydroperoxidase family enzyme
MPTVNPVPPDKADAAAKPIYDDLAKRLGRVPNFHATMAHRPEVLKHFAPFYTAIVAGGTVEPRLKELAYLKVSLINGCEY